MGRLMIDISIIYRKFRRKYLMKKFASLALILLLAVSLLVTPALATSPGLYMEDPNTSNTFAATDADGDIGYNFKSGGGAWVNIMNPWGKSAYLIVEPGEGWVQSLIVTLKVEGYDGGAEGYRVMGGFGINGWSPSIWSLDADGEDNDNWEDVFGQKYYYYIDGDGYYQFIISFRHAMNYFEELNDWYIKDYLEGIDCIELGIFTPPDDTTMKVTIISLDETHNIFSFDSLSRPLGSGKFFADSVAAFPALPTPEPPHQPRIDVDEDGAEDGTAPEDPAPTDPPATDPPATDPPATTPPATDPPPPPATSPPAADNEGGNGWIIWMIVCLAAGGAVAAVIVIRAKKK